MDVIIYDERQIAAAIDAVADEEPDTVAEARALISDPGAAVEAGADEVAVAWLVALAARRRRPPHPRGTAA